jgi:hypothetical protein
MVSHNGIGENVVRKMARDIRINARRLSKNVFDNNFGEVGGDIGVKADEFDDDDDTERF